MSAKIENKNVQDILPLSPVQEGMLFHYLQTTENDYYFEQLSLTIHGELDVNLVTRTWNELIATNEMLRTVFRWKKLPKPVQVIRKTWEIALQLMDLSNLSAAVQVQELANLKARDRATGLDLSSEPFRVSLAKLDTTAYLMIVTYHHILYDGWSTGIILKEFLEIYTALTTGTSLVATRRKTAYKEYVKWLQVQNQAASKEYWTNYLQEFTVPTRLPLAVAGAQQSLGRELQLTLSSAPQQLRSESQQLSIEPQQSLIRERYQSILDEATTSHITRFAAENRVTAANIFYTAWGILLQKYTNSDDVVFGTTVSGRNVPIVGIEEMVGLFINTIPCRIKAHPHTPISTILQEVDQAVKTRGAYEHVPLVEIKSWSEVDHREPLFDSIVVIENYPLDRSVNQSDHPVRIEAYELNESTNFDLALAIESADVTKMQLVYNPALFTGRQIQVLVQHYRNILLYMLDNPAQPLAELKMLSRREEDLLLHSFNDHHLPYPQETFCQLFSHLAQERSGQIAVVAEHQLTYGELEQKATQLAHYLRSKGLHNCQTVGVMAERSVELIIGLMGVLKAGGVYLPINPEYPTQRVLYMLEDSDAEFLLTHKNLAEPLPYTGTVIDLEDTSIYGGQFPSNHSTSLATTKSDLFETANLDDPMYLIYTSGSTGQPKGVTVTYRALNNFLYNMYAGFEGRIGADDRCLSLTNIAFDVSICEIFLPLTFGATLVLYKSNAALDIHTLAQTIVTRGITFAYLPPTILPEVFELLSTAPEVKLNKMLVGVEPIKDFVLEKYLHLHPEMQILNGYGPTEATICATFFKYIDVTPKGNNVPIGRPLANTQIYILDGMLSLVPVGALGELCISGDGLAMGYLNKPDMTAERFIANPFIPGQRMYRTGDMARWLEDGNIHFVGRIDQQVKIRGYRIEPGEVANQLLKHPAVEECVVIPREDHNGVKHLCAYIVAEKSDANISGTELRDFLSHSLPTYMVPSYFVLLESFALTPNGKIDRRALPEPIGNIPSGVEYVAPANDLEVGLANIWQEALGVERVGILDNFFDLGGHSLRATVLAGKIHKMFDVEIPVSQLFQRPTIKELSEFIAHAQKVDHIAIEKSAEKEYYPTSSAQKRIYLLQQYDLSATSYNITGAVEIIGRLDLERIQAVFQRLLVRHETLRTSFHRIGDEIVQKVQHNVEFSVNVVTEQQFARQGLSAAINAFIRPFELSQAPLLRATVLEMAEKRYMLLCDMHHIVSDGTSMSILINEFTELYQGHEMEELAIQYRDYAEWQNRFLHSPAMDKQAEYWLNRFKGEVPILNLPTDHPRPTIQNFAGERISYRLGSELSRNLHKVAKETESTLYMVLLAGINILLAKYSGQDDICIGSPIAGRSHADLQSIIGMFINTLVLRNYPVGEKTYREFLAEVSQTALQAYENQDFQFEELVDRLSLQRDLSRNPLFDVMFVLQNMDSKSLDLPDLQVKPYELEQTTAKFDLTFTASEEAEEVILQLNYSTRLFTRETAQRMLAHLNNILRQVTLYPNTLLRQVDMLADAEKISLLTEFTGAHVEYPKNQALHQLFEAQVAKTPTDIALEYEGQQLTYRALNERANRVARFLRKKGVTRDSIVGLMTERSLEMIIGILGILKAGGAYLPLSPEHPEERVQYMLKNSQASLLLTQTAYMNTHPGESVQLFNLEGEEVLAASGENLPCINHPTDLAYVIYTSGSTGLPKGVMISHRSVQNLMAGLAGIAYERPQTLRVALVAPYYFDASVQQIFPTLLMGHTLLIVPEDTRLEGKKLLAFYREQHIDISDGTPTHLALLANTDVRDGGMQVEHFLIGGEALPYKVVEAFYRRFNDHRPFITNVYGPTECCVDSTSYLITPETFAQLTTIPIGQPLPNYDIYVLNKNLQLQPIGVPGELYIAGEGVGRGYVNNPELTREKFVQNPFRPGTLMYRTGDLARWLSTGDIEFIGRVDYQIKIRGYRIELGEIEHQLLNYPPIKEAVVIDQEDTTGSKHLIAYILAKQTLAAGAIRNFLRKSLPEYMLPAHFVQLPKMPLTANGKIDRKALPAPQELPGTAGELVAARNATEEKLLQIWSEVLGTQRIGITDNFFELGGHSLKANILASRIHQEFQVEIPLRAIFTTPTIEGLGTLIEEAAEAAYVALQPVQEKAYYPVSSAQKRIYILQQFDLQSTAYNMTEILEVLGSLDLARVESVFHQLILRHETLRTSFATVDGQIVQTVHPTMNFALQILYPETEDAAKIETSLGQFIRPFDLASAPLLRVGILPLSENRHILICDMHHIVSDGMSVAILIREFLALYAGHNLENLRVQYKDYAEWQNNYLHSPALERQGQYWLDLFAGEIPTLNLPLDYPRPPVQSYTGAHFSCTFAPELTIEIQRLAQRSSSTVYMILLAGINILLAKYSGQEEIVIGSPVAGRPHADLQKIIGMFVNTLAMRNRPASQRTLHDFLQDVKENTLVALENQDYQFDQLIERLNLPGDLSRNPLFDVMFALQNTDNVELRLPNLEIAPYTYEQGIAKFDLTFVASEMDGQLSLNVEYCTKLFRPATIARMVTHLTNILHKMVAIDSHTQLCHIDMLTDEEKEQLLLHYNATDTDYPSTKSVTQLFEEQAELLSLQVALRFAGKQLTYQMLNARANQVARVLRERGIGLDSIVGLLLNRSIEMVVGMLGILKAGGAYLPINPTYPAERIRFMLEDSRADIVLTHTSLLPEIPFNGIIIALDQLPLARSTSATQLSLTGVTLETESTLTGVISETNLSSTDVISETEVALSELAAETNLPAQHNLQSLAYVIYTSGSTGQPKGVMIAQHSLTNYCYSYRAGFQGQLGPEDRCLSIGNISFDVSVSEIFPPLSFGATLVLFDKLLLEPEAIAQVISTEKVTLAYIAPTLLKPLYEILRTVKENIFLRKVFTGVEAISDYLCEDYMSLHPEMQILNGYGPTETTICTTFYSYVRKTPTGSRIPIGKPLPNTQVYVLDPYCQLVPTGVAGELYISGAGLARGYLGQPGLTAEKFVDHPFIPGQKLYRTGDLVKWLIDGNLEFIDRVDQQVKIRGYRIEPGEVQNHLLKHPSLSAAVVIPWEDVSGSKYLCAYVVAEQTLQAGELREYLLSNLPEYMVPSYFIQLEQLPLTANGKVNRAALPKPEGDTILRTQYVAPRNALEAKLVDVWQEVLGVEQVGIDDNFFELGGHSLKATLLVGKIAQTCNVELTLSNLFATPTIRGVGLLIENATRTAFTAIEKTPEQEYYHTSPAQKRMYLLQQLDLAGTAYNISGMLEVHGQLDIFKVEQTVQQLIERHEILRTSFTRVDERIVQTVHPRVEFSLEIINSASREAQDVNSASQAIHSEMAGRFVRAFDLSKAPLLRVGVMVLAEKHFLLMFDTHHIISDGTSMGILVDEFAALYSGKELDPLPLQYRDFAEWQNSLLHSDRLQAEEGYWLERFSGEVPVLNLPTDFPRPAVQSFQGAQLDLQIERELTSALEHIARDTASTMYMVLLSAINILCAKYSGQEDIVIGTPTAGRAHPDLEKMIGMFVNTLAMRNYPEGRMTYDEFLREVRANTLSAFENQDFQFEELVDRLQLRRDLSRNPLFDIMFAMQNIDQWSLTLPDATLKTCDCVCDIAKFDLSITATAIDGQIQLNFEYAEKLFTRETITRMSTHLLNILQAITANPQIKLSSIPLLSDEEKQQILYGFNATQIDYPANATIHELFVRQVAKNPAKPAIVGTQHLTYGELHARTTRLAHRLREVGVTVDTLVGIIAGRSVEMIIGMMAVLQAGGAYLPIDPDYPKERIMVMLEDSAIDVLLAATTDGLNATHAYDFRGVVIDLAAYCRATGEPAELANINTPTDLAYVMYTSGSTGKPKGVMIEHRGVVNLAQYYNQLFHLDQGKNVLHMSNVSFDTSVVEIFPPLIFGSTIYIIQKELALDRVGFRQYVEANQINFAQFVPMTLQAILDDGERLPSLEAVIVGSDKLDDQLKDHILELGYPLTNHYGPTEGTVDALVAVCAKGQTVIGKPIANTRAYILDKDQNLAPIGVPGELCIAGDGLARGYLRQPGLTQEKFVPNPWVDGEHIYRTGDLVSWQADGNIVFHGRIDAQVKIRGYRVEPAEIEEHLLQYPGITGAVVIDRMDQNGIRYLCAYLVAESELSIAELRAQLAGELPEYLIPSYFQQIERVPLTHNGKVDRRALPEPEMDFGNGIAYCAPVSQIEHRLVEIWQEVLGNGVIGTGHNFFELGGHSLKAMALVARIQKEWNVQVPFNDIFKHPTIRELAQLITEAQPEDYVRIEPVAEREYYPLSSAQLRLFIQWQLTPQTKSYNMPAAVILDGQVEKHNLENALRLLVNRHEALRTSFELVDGVPMQKIHPHTEIALNYLETTENQVADIVAEFVQPFDLGQAPLLRVALVKFAPDKHLLLFDMHHIISDGVSMSILIADFGHFLLGKDLQPLRIQYKDYAIWHNSLRETDKWKRMREYWLHALRNFTYTELPESTFSTSAKASGKLLQVSLDEELTGKINDFCQQQQMTKFTFLLGIFELIIWRTINQDDLTIGIAVAGREQQDLEDIIGVFLNVMVVRNTILPESSFAEYLRKLHSVVLEAQKNQDYPYELLYSQAREQWNLEHNSLFSILFNYMPYQERGEMQLDGLTINPYPLPELEPKYGLTMYVNENRETISLHALFSSNLQETMVETMLNSFPRVITAVLEEQNIPIDDLTLAGRSNIEQFFDAFEFDFDNDEFQ